jgi:hypothetical protein
VWPQRWSRSASAAAGAAAASLPSTGWSPQACGKPVEAGPRWGTAPGSPQRRAFS